MFSSSIYACEISLSTSWSSRLCAQPVMSKARAVRFDEFIIEDPFVSPQKINELSKPKHSAIVVRFVPKGDYIHVLMCIEELAQKMDKLISMSQNTPEKKKTTYVDSAPSPRTPKQSDTTIMYAKSS